MARNLDIVVLAIIGLCTSTLAKPVVNPWVLGPVCDPRCCVPDQGPPREITSYITLTHTYTHTRHSMNTTSYPTLTITQVVTEGNFNVTALSTSPISLPVALPSAMLSSTPASSLDCQQDNCLRQLIGASSAIAPFCATYTASINTMTTNLPLDVAFCTGDFSRISSACSCIMTNAIPALTQSGAIASVSSQLQTEPVTVTKSGFTKTQTITESPIPQSNTSSTLFSATAAIPYFANTRISPESSCPAITKTITLTSSVPVPPLADIPAGSIAVTTTQSPSETSISTASITQFAATLSPSWDSSTTLTSSMIPGVPENECEDTPLISSWVPTASTPISIWEVGSNSRKWIGK